MRTTLRHFALLATIASASSFAVAQDAATQAGRRQADQSPLSTQSQTQGQGRAGAQPGRAGQADQVGGQAARQAAGMTVTQFLAHELRRGNEAEVELGRIASEKAQNDQVKKFAQTMVEHHTPFIQQLQQIEQRGGAAGQGGAGAGAAAGGALRERVGQSETDSQDESSSSQGNTRRATGNVRNSESGTDGVQQPQGARAPGGSSQATTTAGQTPGTATPGTPRTTAGQAVAGQAGAAGGMMSGQVPHQLVAVIDQACDTELQMTKEMLQEHEGQDFDMGYIGQQIVAHTQMLAKLQAIRNSGPQELQQLAMQGEQVTRQHLDMAKQIADQIKNKGESGSQSPTRSARNPGADAPSSNEQK